MSFTLTTQKFDIEQSSSTRNVINHELGRYFGVSGIVECSRSTTSTGTDLVGRAQLQQPKHDSAGGPVEPIRAVRPSTWTCFWLGFGSALVNARAIALARHLECQLQWILVVSKLCPSICGSVERLLKTCCSVVPVPRSSCATFNQPLASIFPQGTFRSRTYSQLLRREDLTKGPFCRGLHV